MARPGPPPKPTQLRVIEGNPGKRALNKYEPKPEPCRPSCPKHLDKAAKAEWRRVTKELEKLKMLTLLDRAALAAYCQVYSRWKDAEEKIAQFGGVIKGSVGGTHLVLSPYMRIANECIDQLKALSQEFGFTPSSRSRITIPSQKGQSLDEIAAARAAARANAVRSG